MHKVSERLSGGDRAAEEIDQARMSDWQPINPPELMDLEVEGTIKPLLTE